MGMPVVAGAGTSAVGMVLVRTSGFGAVVVVSGGVVVVVSTTSIFIGVCLSRLIRWGSEIRGRCVFGNAIGRGLVWSAIAITAILEGFTLERRPVFIGAAIFCG